MNTRGPLNETRKAERLIEEARRDGRRGLEIKLDLAALPESIGELHQLKQLYLSGNRLNGLPDSLGNLTGLEALLLNGNPIVNSLTPIRRLTNLRVLDLNSIGLRQLPDWISELRELVYLDLSHNKLETLPETIGDLERLSSFFVQRNRLTALPNSLRSLERLVILHLHSNPELGIPSEILEHADPKIILNYYFRTTKAVARPLNEAKLILVGRGEVGKTSLVRRLVNNEFQRDERKTEGIQITPWPIQLPASESINLQIWDFGGQEIMHATHQFFLTERSLYLLVLNGREGGEDVDIEYWLKLIESFGADSPVIVVLNKIRAHPFDLNRRGLEQKYPRIRAFVRTDCEDATGIEELRGTIFRETDRLPHLRDKFPAAWFSIKDRLSTMKENYISFERYRELCRKLGESDEQAQELLASALHCLGIALNYKDDPRLRETHILNPHWVTNGIYAILNSKRLEQNLGELDIQDLGGILDRGVYPPSMHEFLLNLMRRFELCFRFPEPRDRVFLVPQLLSKEQPALGDGFAPESCLNLQYQYPVLPEGILPRFIVRTHALSKEQPRWRTGVVLSFEGNTALIKADPQEKGVTVSVTGPLEGRRRLLAIIRSDFERIHADIPKLNPTESVPLPQSPSVAIAYDELRAFEEVGVEVFPKVVGGKVVRVEVKKLLNSVELPVSSAAHPVTVFVSYSHKDDEFRAELDSHLKLFQRLKLIAAWNDRRIPPGDEWKKEIDRNLETSDLILLLVSSDFLASDYCYEIEMRRALERNDANEARVVPIIVRDCQWQRAEFGKLQVLPRDAKPVRLWPDRDSAWSNVAKGIEQIITDFAKSTSRSAVRI